MVVQAEDQSQFPETIEIETDFGEGVVVEVEVEIVVL